MDKRLQGKTIMITGGARRIGKNFSLAAARAGANVIVHFSSSAAEAEETTQAIKSFGVNAWVARHDLSDVAGISEFIHTVWDETPFDCLVNNAAIFEPLGFAETEINEWQRHLSINLTAPFLLSKAFASLLPQDRKGRIVNILDWRALRPGKDHFPYTISKAALAALTKSMALSLAPRISVNGLALGAILPPSDGTDEKLVLANVPLARWAEKGEAEDALLFLLTGPEYITGEILHVDGGRHLV